jgi:hypothetical protein
MLPGFVCSVHIIFLGLPAKYCKKTDSTYPSRIRVHRWLFDPEYRNAFRDYTLGFQVAELHSRGLRLPPCHLEGEDITLK